MCLSLQKRVFLLSDGSKNFIILPYDRVCESLCSDYCVGVERRDPIYIIDMMKRYYLLIIPLDNKCS